MLFRGAPYKLWENASFALEQAPSPDRGVSYACGDSS